MANKKITKSISLNQDTYYNLKAYADQDRRTLSSAVDKLLEERLKEIDKWILE